MRGEALCDPLREPSDAGRPMAIALVKIGAPEENYSEDLVFAEASRGTTENMIWSAMLDVRSHCAVHIGCSPIIAKV